MEEQKTKPQEEETVTEYVERKVNDNGNEVETKEVTTEKDGDKEKLGKVGKVVSGVSHFAASTLPTIIKALIK